MQGFTNFSDIYSHYRAVAHLLGYESFIESFLLEFKQEVESFSSKSKTKNNSILSITSDGVIAGKNTLVDEIIHYAGGQNIASKYGIQGWQKVNHEFLLLMEPDWILVAGEESEKEHVIQSLLFLPALREKKSLLRES